MVNSKEGLRRYRRYYRNLQGLYQKPVVRDFTFLILSLLTVAFFGFFAIRPSLRTIGELIKEVKDKRMASEKLEQKINLLSIAQREYESIKPDLPAIYAVLPKKSDFSKLVKQLEYLAGKNNSTLLNFRIQKTSLFGEEKKELTPLEFTLNISGEYKNLKGFLEDLGKLDRLVKVETLDFQKKKAGKEEKEILLTLRLSAEGYYLQ